jgi:hypothetical protein
MDLCKENSKSILKWVNQFSDELYSAFLKSSKEMVRLVVMTLAAFQNDGSQT